MTTSLAHIAGLVVLLGVAFGTGQLVAGAAGLRRLRHLDATAATASLVLGAFAWTIGFSFLSGIARRPAGDVLSLIAVGHAVLLVVAWRRGAAFPRARGPATDWLLLGGALLVTGVLGLLPVLRFEGFLAGNDTHTYCALAEWLQDHGFGETVGTATNRSEAIAAQYQRQGFPLGATYPLALARAARPGSSSLALYPGVSTLGLLLGLCSLWWMARHSLRLRRPAITAALAIFAFAPNAAYWAHHNGFLSQTFAVSGLVMGLAALDAPRGISTRLGVVSLSFAVAFLYVVYVPFLVLVGVAALAHLVSDLVGSPRVTRLRSRLMPWGKASILSLMLVGLDPTPVLRAAPHLARSQTVGSHVSLEPASYGAIALGPGPGAFAGAPGWLEPGTAPIALGAAVVAAIGLIALLQQRRGLGSLVALAALGGLLLKYALFANDPWSGEVGQTWFAFKVVQWIFPLALLLQAAGLQRLQRGERSLVALAAGGALALAPAHLPWSVKLSEGLARIVLDERPLAKLDTLLEGFRSLPPGELVLTGQPRRSSVFRDSYAALFAYPRRLVVDREDDPPQLRRLGGGDVVPVLAEAPPFDGADRRELGGGFATLVTVDRPRLAQVAARVRPVHRPDREGLVVPLGRWRTKLLVLAPRPGPVEVALLIEPPAGADTSEVRCRVIPGLVGGTEYRWAVRHTRAQRLGVVRGAPTLIRFEAEAGLNSILLTSARLPQRLKDVAVRADTSQRRVDALR